MPTISALANRPAAQLRCSDFNYNGVVMSRSISAANANREFSSMLRRVRQGESFVVTSHGRPVAKIVPVSTGDQITLAARGTLLRRLRGARAKRIGGWTRDELYEQ